MSANTTNTKARRAFSLGTTKVIFDKDITKVLDFFRYNTGTTLDAMLATGVLRNSITWYVSDLEDAGLIRAVSIKKDKHTGRLAKHYSADPAAWRQERRPRVLSIFNEEDEA